MNRILAHQEGAEEAFYPAIELALFEIDIYGQIWRIAEFSTAGDGAIKPCEPRRAEGIHADKDRYQLVKSVFPGGEVVRALAHRVVWRHFKGPIPLGLTINHRDGIRSNNRSNNLELATHSEQKLHSIHVLGRICFDGKRYEGRGEAHGGAKLTESQVREIRAATGWGASRKMAEKFGLCKQSVSLIRTRRSWKHVA